MKQADTVLNIEPNPTKRKEGKNPIPTSSALKETLGEITFFFNPRDLEVDELCPCEFAVKTGMF